MDRKLVLTIEASFTIKSIEDIKNSAQAVEDAMENLLCYGNAEIKHLDIKDSKK